MSSSASGAIAVLERLQVPRDRLLYVQASADWLQRAGIEPLAMLDTLRQWVGNRGTLVMPTYPFHTTHQAYLDSEPSFDVLRTPSAVGLLPEIFRRTTGTVRSLDPDFCVTALGPDADAIAGTEPAALDPFGPESSYQRMLDRDAVLVGLGVSLNTNSFIHVIDSRAGAGYPIPVYGERLYSLRVADARGGVRDVRRKALRPHFQQQTAPAVIADEMRPTDDVFRTIAIGQARFFRWELSAWSGWCLEHARRRASLGAWPCWLHRLEASTGTPSLS